MNPGIDSGQTQPEPPARVVYVIGSASGLPSLIRAVLCAEGLGRILLSDESHLGSPICELFPCHYDEPLCVVSYCEPPLWREWIAKTGLSSKQLAYLREIWPFSRGIARHFSRRAIV